VHVLDLLEYRGRLEDIAVVTPAPLPKAIVHVSVRLPILHTDKKGRSLPTDKQQGALRHRLLDRVENVADVIVQLGRPDQEMSVLRHDDVRPDMETKFAARTIHRLDQPCATSILAQERLPLKAGKRESMGVARVVVPFAGFRWGIVDDLEM
jgi:hypothetical protein